MTNRENNAHKHSLARFEQRKHPEPKVAPEPQRESLKFVQDFERRQPGVAPGASRHVSSRDINSEEYYTNDWLAKKVAAIASKFEADLYVEPAVGGGAIYQHLPTSKRCGVEIEDVTPFDENVRTKHDFFDFQLSARCADNYTVVVGNPPFAGATQIRFLNHASSLCENVVIVFVMGLSMRKWSNIVKVDKYLHLEKEWIVPRQYSWFMNHGKKVKVPTVVQVWRRKLTHIRQDVHFDPVPGDAAFCVLPCTRWKEANLVVKRFASLACVGEPGLVQESSNGVQFVEVDGQVLAYDDTASRRFGTVVSKSGAQGTLMLLKCNNAAQVFGRIHSLWKNSIFRDYTTDATSNVGNGVCINKEELVTIYNGRAGEITRKRSYLS